MTDLFTRALVGTKFSTRRNDLLTDGYTIVFERCDQFGAFAKLRHRNGTIIILTCDYGKGEIIQKTNGKVVHTDTVHKY